MLSEPGILANSVRYFHTPEPFAAAHLFSSERAGDYHCTKEYAFSRPASDVRTCQLMLVTEGELLLEYHNEKYIVKPGYLVAMRLGEEQRYCARSDQMHMLWLHIDGPSAGAYIEEINRNNGVVFPVISNPDIERDLRQIIRLFSKGITDDRQYSVLIHQLFNTLSLPFASSKKEDIRETVNLAISYMETHYADSHLSLAELTTHFSVSKSYFLRKFKAFTGVTPHQYLLSIRIRIAKQLLDTTSESIESIAEKCGFYSASHFIMYFHRTTGMTPLQFRQLWR